jgi:hypothetical protein
MSKLVICQAARASSCAGVVDEERNKAVRIAQMIFISWKLFWRQEVYKHLAPLKPEHRLSESSASLN